MIKLEKTDVYGWESAVRGMRNPMNSWNKIDSHWEYAEDGKPTYKLGDADLHLMQTLSNSGNDHAKFLRMIHVTVDVTAPLYWWKEADTYKVGTTANSCSTMHKIQAKEFVLDDFSHEHLINGTSKIMLKAVLDLMNQYRNQYLDTKNKEYWWQMIQLLPSSYNQKRTWDLNYQVLKNIYHARKNHKLDEWHDVCSWIESLPYSELIIGVVDGKESN